MTISFVEGRFSVSFISIWASQSRSDDTIHRRAFTSSWTTSARKCTLSRSSPRVPRQKRGRREVGRSGGWLLTRSGWQKWQRSCVRGRGGFLTFLCASAANPDLAALLQAISFASRKGRARRMVKNPKGYSAEHEETTFTLWRTRRDWREPAMRRRRW